MRQRISINTLQLRKYATRQNRPIITLDPKKLVQLQQPAIDLSNLQVARVFPLGGYSVLKFDSRSTQYIPFPSGTRGFLYYHSPSDRPRIAGQLRFRVTPSDDPASFSHGHDLTFSRTSPRSPTPWNIYCFNIPNNKAYASLHSHLVNEGLVEGSLVAAIRKMRPIQKLDNGTKFLFTLSDPFEIDYAKSPIIKLRAVTEYGQGNITYIRTLSESIPTFKSGIINACFERSTLPEHEGNRVVVMRCLRVVEPLVMKSPKIGQIMDPQSISTYTPTPGQILQNLPRGQKTARAWSMDISDDSKHLSAPALRLLW
ncbi:hypothetical protein BJ165DRAFT_1599301 [Panaeolus papilionaceus]|nr:hypothetical protein BJ165DRAFT_1599301 [Panaeolus papilionaceus]